MPPRLMSPAAQSLAPRSTHRHSMQWMRRVTSISSLASTFFASSVPRSERKSNGANGGDRDQCRKAREAPLRTKASSDSPLQTKVGRPTAPLQTKVRATDGLARASSDESTVSCTSSDESAPFCLFSSTASSRMVDDDISTRNRVCPPSLPFGFVGVWVSLSLSLVCVGVPRVLFLMQSQQTLYRVRPGEAPNERKAQPHRRCMWVCVLGR